MKTILLKMGGRFLQLVGVLAVLGVLAGAVGLYFAGQWLQHADEPAQADAIVCLSGDTQRLLYAAELFQQGLSPRILVSRPEIRPQDPRMDLVRQRLGYPAFEKPEDYVRAFLAALDVPPGAVEFYGQGVVSTVEEAEALRDHLAGEAASLLVVTSPYHAFRAGKIFRDILPDCAVRILANPNEPFEARWWTDRHSAIQVVLESVKLVHYLLGGSFRSTDAAPAR